LPRIGADQPALRLARLAGLFLMPLLGILATRAAWLDMLNIAQRDEESSHLFLVPIVAVWLALVRLDRLRACRVRGTLLGPVVVVLGAALYVIGFENAIQSFWHLGAVVTAVGCLLTVTGAAVLRAAWPAFLVLGFLVPVPGLVRQQMALPMQEWTATATEFFGQIVGLDLVRAGSVLVINGREVGIAEACNGMRMVFALFLATYAFVFINRLSTATRVVILVAAPLLAISANVIRLVPTVALYGYADAEIADAFHDFGGWVMVLLAFVAMFGALGVWRWVMDADDAASSQPAGRATSQEAG
jgi:exosortase